MKEFIQQERVLASLQCGVSLILIAKSLGCPRTTVYRMKAKRHSNRKKRSGRKYVLYTAAKIIIKKTKKRKRKKKKIEKRKKK